MRERERGLRVSVYEPDPPWAPSGQPQAPPGLLGQDHMARAPRWGERFTGKEKGPELSFLWMMLSEGPQHGAPLDRPLGPKGRVGGESPRSAINKAGWGPPRGARDYLTQETEALATPFQSPAGA